MRQEERDEYCARIEHIRHEQGWNDLAMLALSLGHIQNSSDSDILPSFVKKLEEQQKEENA